MSNQVKEENCNSCRFYWGPPVGIGAGICRRHPPVKVLEDNDRIPEWGFPTIEPENWCGEFKAMMVA